MTHHPPDLGADGPAARARLTRDAVFRGRAIGRQVCEPIEAMHHAGQITDAQYEAARRVRAALAGSWPEPRVSTRWNTHTSVSDLDEATDGLTDEEVWEHRARLHRLWRASERICGPECWPWVSGVCRGYWLGSQGRVDLVRRGLDLLAREWRLTR